MATLQELENGLRKAHAAGNADHARAFANEIRKMRSGADFSGVSQAVSSTEPRLDSLSEADWQKERDQISEKDPLEGTGNYRRYLAGVAKSGLDAGRGIQQGAVDAMNRSAALIGVGLDKVLPGSGVTRAYMENVGAPIARRSQQLEQRTAQNRVDEAPIAGSAPGMAGNIVGTLGQMFLPAAALRGAALGKMMLPTTLRGNALLGGVVGGVQPVASQDERGVNAAAGGLAGSAGAAVPKVGGALARIVSPRGLSAAEAGAGQEIRREATNPNALDQLSQSQVPGVHRTLGEATGDSGLSALENTVRASNRGMFDQIDTANNVARMRVLEGISGDPAKRAAAVQARTDAAIPALDRAKLQKGVDTSSALQEIDGLIKQYTGNKPMQEALRKAEEGIKASDGDMAYLENARQFIGKLIDGTADGSNIKLPDMLGAKDALTGTMRKASPDFATYLDSFVAHSKPINRMDTGRAIIRRSTGTVPDDTGTPRITPAGFSKVSRDLDIIAAKATGFRRAKASDILSPDDLSGLRAIQDDMQRQFARQSSATPGPQTFERGEVAGRIAKKSAAAGIARIIPGAGAALDYFEQQATARVKERLAYLVANPAEAQRVLKALNKSDRAVVTNMLVQLGGRGGASAPALAE